MSRFAGTSEAAVREEIAGDVRRLLQASGVSGARPTRESVEAEALRLETERICARLKAEARERCRGVQAEYRRLVGAYCSPRPVEWPRVARPRLEGAFVEFRPLPHLRALVANAILRLRCDVSIVCGRGNADFVEGLAATIGYPVRVVRLDVGDVDREAYSALLASPAFWRKLRGDWVLIHQEDALVFDGSRVDAILAGCESNGVVYLGAPWRGPQVLDCCVGNGGFSLRRRDAMREICEARDIRDFPRGAFPFQDPAELHPEDIFFAYWVRKDHPPKSLDAWLRLAVLFSTESVPDGGVALGGHQFWLADEDGWRDRAHAALSGTLGPGSGHAEGPPADLDFNVNHSRV